MLNATFEAECLLDGIHIKLTADRVVGACHITYMLTDAELPSPADQLQIRYAAIDHIIYCKQQELRAEREGAEPAPTAGGNA